MKILPLSRNISTGNLLFDPLDTKDLANGLLHEIDKKLDSLRQLTDFTSKGITFRGIREPGSTVDPGNPKEAGWTFLINQGDPHRNEIIEAIQPLAEYRMMKDPDKPLLFDGSSSAPEWEEWIENNYGAKDSENQKLEKPPHYVLLVGDPVQIPFHFQSHFGTRCCVGRLDFDTTDDLKTYVEKIIEFEKSTEPLVNNEATFFATNHGFKDPTYYSLNYMEKPLAQYVKNNGMNVVELVDKQATKANLLSSLSESKSALVYTASHGLEASNQSLDVQKQVTGALCCQDFDPKTGGGILSAADIPDNDHFLEGSILFQFACFGYGTPVESDFTHWFFGPKGWSMPSTIAKAEFVSAIPKKLLAKRHGPIAYVGHVDTALLQGFDDLNNPEPINWNPRMRPYTEAVDELMNARPIGFAMTGMAERLNSENGVVANMLDSQKRGKVIDNKFYMDLSDHFLRRTDAQNFLIFGDPAVSLRLPDNN